MARKYTVKLTAEERTQLQAVAKGRKGKMAIAAWKVTHAKALLNADRGEFGPAWTDKQNATALGVSERSLMNWKKPSRVRCADRSSHIMIDVWPHSSIHRWVEKGVYKLNWGCTQGDPVTISKLNTYLGE